mgnify:CR=1 FL=1
MSIKKFFTALFICLFTCTLALHADGNIPPIDDGWNHNGTRSISVVPEISKSGSTIYIYSEVTIPNMSIVISNANGTVVYNNVATVNAGTYFPIDLSLLPAGYYTIGLYSGSNYLTAGFYL